MGLRDRDYMQVERRAPAGGRAPASLRLRGWTVVGVLLVANALVYLLEVSGVGPYVLGLGVLRAEDVARGEVWRLVTSTYLHADLMHLLFNMLGLYFLGPPLERAWGPWRFLALYTAGGVLANLALTVAGLVGFFPPGAPALGASGSVLTVIGATAVLYPRAVVLVFGLLPLTLATFALVYGALFVFNVVQQGGNYGGDLAHLVGLIAGAAWAYLGPWGRGAGPGRGYEYQA